MQHKQLTISLLCTYFYYSWFVK